MHATIEPLDIKIAASNEDDEVVSIHISSQDIPKSFSEIPSPEKQPDEKNLESISNVIQNSASINSISYQAKDCITPLSNSIPLSSINISSNLSIGIGILTEQKLLDPIKLGKIKKKSAFSEISRSGSIKSSWKAKSLYASKRFKSHIVKNWGFIKQFFRYFFYPYAISCAITIIFSLIQERVMNDYCFVSELCECRNIISVIYTVFRESISNTNMILTFSFFFFFNQSAEIHQKLKIKILFYVLALSITWFTSFFIYFNNKKKFKLETLRMYIGIILILFSMIFFLLFHYFTRTFTKKICWKSLRAFLIAAIILFHDFVIKEMMFPLIFIFLIKSMKSLAESVNLFKLFMLIYYTFFQFIMKKCFYYLLKDFEKEKLPYHAIVFGCKFLAIEVISTNIINIITVPIKYYVFWISLINFYYNFFVIYCRYNPILYLFRRIFKKTEKPDSKELLCFKEIENTCSIEINLLIFFRILIIKYGGQYFEITAFVDLYQDCSLKIRNSAFIFYEDNLVLLIVSYFIILFIMIIFMFKKTTQFFNLRFERLHPIYNIFIMIIYQSSCETYIQFQNEMFKMTYGVY